MKLADEKNLAGCCGIYCGLCPRFQSSAPSRCPGGRVLSQTISCKRYNCCVKEAGYPTCADCGHFPCDRYGGFFDWDSFVSHRVCVANLEKIRTVGLSKWLKEQNATRQLLEQLLANYNDGRSMSFFCIATALLPPGSIRSAVREAERQIDASRVNDSDVKTRAKMVRATIQECAKVAGIDLKLRRKTKQA